MNYDNLYCKIFIDTEYDKNYLINEINKLVCGKKTLIRTIETNFGEIDLNRNEDFDMKKRELKLGFVYWRYYLDIEPNEQITKKDYIHNISILLQQLHKNGFKAVAACDFEEELPIESNF